MKKIIPFIKSDSVSKIHEYAEAITETVREPLLVLDNKLKVLLANASFYKTFNVSSKKTDGKFIYEIGNKQWDIPALRILLEQIIPKNKYFENYEIRHDFKDIGTRVMLLNARKFEHLNLILLAIEDITEEKKLTEYTIQASKLATIGLLSSSLAHGLNGPLTGVINFLEVYVNQEQKGSPKYEELNLILNSCRHMAEVVRKLTYFVSDGNEKFVKLDLVNIVSEALLFVEVQVVARKIKLIRDFSKEPVMVLGSKNQLQQMLLNIVINAKEAIGREGKITVRIKNNKKDKFAILEVVDTGVGISKANLLNLFTPFFTTKKAVGGVGLGLFSSREIAMKHGGNIKVKSIKGKGAKIIINLPTIK